LASACCCNGIVSAAITTTPSSASATTIAIIAIDVFVVVVISLSSPLYGWKHRPSEALIPVEVIGHPLASACCSGILTIVIATTPSNPNANTIAITA